MGNFQQDRDSAVGGSGYWEVAYQLAKATSGRNTLRRTQVTLPGGTVFKYHYLSLGSHASAASRVSSLRDASDTELVGYAYNGAGQVVKTELMEVDLYSRLYSTGTSFVNLDRFDRVITNRWRRDLSTDRDVYHVALAYDRNSNITSQDDQVHAGHDVAYVNDGLNRLTGAEEGTWTGSAITSRTRDQQWTLSQTGNWEVEKLDLDGDQNWNESGEHQDDRTHNAVNELTARDVDDDSTDDYSLTYDTAGNLTDDGEAYTYEWDAFYRLRRVRERETDDLVAEYWYNGLGYLLTRHQDTDTDGDVDGDDKKFHTAYDERWRPVAVYRESDSDPKERFFYHAAGWGGFGTSSYIDLVVLRDRDANAGWTAASDGTLEERVYYAQNWRADVVALVKVGDQMQEWVKYSAYGVPFAIPGGDTDSDGDCDSTDVTQVQSWINGATYDVHGDIDLDGDVDATDKSTIEASFEGTTLGRGTLSATGVRNRKGYAGYEFDRYIGQKYHVRHRVLDSGLGRWMRRDPLIALGLSDPYQYALSRSTAYVDTFGLTACGASGTYPYREAHVTGWFATSLGDLAQQISDRARAEAATFADCESCPPVSVIFPDPLANQPCPYRLLNPMDVYNDALGAAQANCVRGVVNAVDLNSGQLRYNYACYSLGFDVQFKCETCPSPFTWIEEIVFAFEVIDHFVDTEILPPIENALQSALDLLERAAGAFF